MNRRLFLAGSCTVAATASRVFGAAAPAADFVLSRRGCGRASGYAETNKIITHDGRTHVAWLDSEAGGFRARIRTLDRSNGTWGSTVTLGEAHDNHGGPALTIDREGFLHAVYGPHHHPFRYRRSRRPNDAGEWEDEIRFGERLTYPTLVCAADNSLVLTARRSHAKQPWEMELWRKPPGQDWRFERMLARARYPGYAHFQEGLVWGPDHRTLHLFCRFHERSDKTGYGRIQTLAYLRSSDGGASWSRADGEPIALPTEAPQADVIAAGGLDVGRVLRVGGLAVDGQGHPVIAYSVVEETSGRGDCFVARPDQAGRWQSRPLRPFLPPRYSGWNFITPGCLTITDDGVFHFVGQLFRPETGVSGWGHPSNEVALLRSHDNGRSFSFQLLSGPDAETPNWLPNLERPTGFNRVPANPGMIYTAGGKGDRNTEILANDVIWKTLPEA